MLYVILLSILIMVAIVAIIIYLSKDASRQKYEEEIAALKQELFGYERSVYVPITDIRAGDTVSLDNVVKTTTVADVNSSYFFADSDLGKVALVDLVAGVPVMKSMCTSTTLPAGLREFECNKLVMNSNLIANDYVDVKIVFPNAEDYTVLSKKPIKNVDQETGNCFFWLTEDEILLLTSAMLDAEQIQGTKIYTTKYIRPTLQEASAVDYPLNLFALDVMGYTPNSLDKLTIATNNDRSALEERIKDFLGVDSFGTTVAWDASKPNQPEEGDSSLDPEEEPGNEEPVGDDAFTVDFNPEGDTDWTPPSEEGGA